MAAWYRRSDKIALVSLARRMSLYASAERLMGLRASGRRVFSITEPNWDWLLSETKVVANPTRIPNLVPSLTEEASLSAFSKKTISPEKKKIAARHAAFFRPPFHPGLPPTNCGGSEGQKDVGGRIF